MAGRPISGHVYRHEGKRGAVWRAKYRLPDGRQVHRTVGPAWTERGRPAAGSFTKRTAEAWLRDVLDQATRGLLPGMVRTGVTFAAAAEEYLRHLEHDRERKPSTLRDYRSIIAAHLLTEFGDMAIEDVTAEGIEAWAATLPVANRTKVKILTILHGILERARRLHRLPRNPMADVDKPRHRRKVTGLIVFSVEEVMALARAAESEQDAAIFLTAAFTGLRRGELVALRWRAVDFAHRRLRVTASYTGELSTPKSGSARSLPMSRPVAEALARLAGRPRWTGEEDLVFPGVIGGFMDASAMSRRYKTALRRAGLRELRFHDLRHTFGTQAVAQGATLVQVQAWMGHADIRTTMAYQHYAARDDEADLLDRAFDAGPVQEEAVSTVRRSSRPAASGS